MRDEPYDMLDTTPTTATPDTLFVPFLWPDEPDRNNASDTAAPYQVHDDSLEHALQQQLLLDLGQRDEHQRFVQLHLHEQLPAG